MTVAELIEKLRSMPQDAIALIESSSGKYEPQFINSVSATNDDLWGVEAGIYPKPFVVMANNYDGSVTT